LRTTTTAEHVASLTTKVRTLERRQQRAAVKSKETPQQLINGLRSSTRSNSNTSRFLQMDDEDVPEPRRERLARHTTSDDSLTYLDTRYEEMRDFRFSGCS